MKTRVNLYLPELKPKKEFLTLKNTLVCWLVVSTVMLIVSLVFSNSVKQVNTQVNKLQRTVNSAKTTLTATQVQLEKKQDKTPFIKRIEQFQKEIEQKQHLLDLMLDKNQKAQFDYASVMRDLARYSNEQVWLSEFYFSGYDITLSGFANHGSALPVWLSDLEQSTYFNNKAFSLIEFEQQKDVVLFNIATRSKSMELAP